MAWLLCEGRPVATLEVADTYATRFKGLLGRSQFEGAMLITKSSSVHTLGMKFPIDVAFCDRHLRVISVVTMAPNRLSLPRRRARTILEATAGAFERWGLHRGAKLEVRA